MLFFCFNHPSTTEIYTLSLHDALPIWGIGCDDYFFGDFANLQANVDVHAAADVDDHTLLQELLESPDSCGHRVSAGREIGSLKSAAFVASRFGGNVSRGGGHNDLSTGNDSTRRIVN